MVPESLLRHGCCTKCGRVVKYFQPVSPAREPDTVVVPRAFVQAAHGHDILSETFYPTVKCEDAVFVMHVKDSAPFAAQGGMASTHADQFPSEAQEIGHALIGAIETGPPDCQRQPEIP